MPELLFSLSYLQNKVYENIFLLRTICNSDSFLKVFNYLIERELNMIKALLMLIFILFTGVSFAGTGHGHDDGHGHEHEHEHKDGEHEHDHDDGHEGDHGDNEHDDDHGHDDDHDHDEIAHVPAALSGIIAMEQFAEENNGSENIVGFYTDKNSDSASVYNIANEGKSLVKSNYSCDLDKENCEYVDSKNLLKGQHKSNLFTIEEMEQALAYIFEHKIKEESLPNIETIKLWQLLLGPLNYMGVRINESALFECHYHGNHIDCHQRLGGRLPGEPK